MTARPGEGVYGDGVGVVTSLAHKLSQNGPIVKDSTGKPRSGVFYAGTASFVTGKANMSYDVAAFEAAICRGRTKGTSFPTNDGVVNVTTTAAPGSNSRIDIIYLQQQEVSEGDAATQAVVGVVQGTAASSPSAPSLPNGAIELARAVVPAGITATTSATITQTAPFTAPLGSPFQVRTTSDLATLPAFPPGVTVTVLDAQMTYRSEGATFKPWASPPILRTGTVLNNVTVGAGGTLVSYMQFANGVVHEFGKFTAGTGSSVTGAIELTTAFTMDTALYQGHRIQVGTILVEDVGTASNPGSATAISTSRVGFLVDNASATYSTQAQVTGSTPMTWSTVNGDTVSWDFWYLPA